MHDSWTNPDRVALGPYFGWLCTRLPMYPDTMFLKTMVHPREVGVRPFVMLAPTRHPLAIDQRDGLEAERVRNMVERMLHEDDEC